MLSIMLIAITVLGVVASLIFYYKGFSKGYDKGWDDGYESK